MACAASGVVVCGTTVGIGATAPEILYGSNPSAGITVLGYVEDLRFYGNVNVNIIMDIPGYTWDGTNVPALNQAMSQRRYYRVYFGFRAISIPYFSIRSSIHSRDGLSERYRHVSSEMIHERSS